MGGNNVHQSDGKGEQWVRLSEDFDIRIQNVQVGHLFLTLVAFLSLFLQHVSHTEYECQQLTNLDVFQSVLTYICHEYHSSR